MKQLLNLLLTTLLLASCSSDKEEPIIPEPVPEPEIPMLVSLSFSCYDNPIQLTADVKGEIIGDSIVDCWVPNIMSDKELIPQVEFVGESIMFDDIPVAIGSTKHDFKKPVKLTIINGNKSKHYTIYVNSYTGLPVLWIETKDREEITSKDEYLRASFKLVENVRTRAAGDITEDSVSIKGRGNSTWYYPKKPYRLKFDKKISLLNEVEDKSWVLLANYLDRTMLCNNIAFYISKFSNLEYTPKSHFVELMLNGQYWGTYELVEKIKVAKHRVNIGKEDYLLEIDGYATMETGTRYFSVPHLDNVVNIKEPEVEYDDKNYLYVKDFLNRADSVLYSDSFTDINEGWQKYIDINTFVDWYLISEISKNTDSFWWNGYISLQKGGKLKMGPVWDFDNAFGFFGTQDNASPMGFFVIDKSWYARLFQDPAFVSEVKNRFNHFYGMRSSLIQYINENARYLQRSAEENNNKWNVLYNHYRGLYKVWGSYENEIFYLKEWLNTRFEWLKGEFDRM